MEGQIVTLEFSYIAGIVGAILSALITTIVFLYKRLEKKDKVMHELTKDFITASQENRKALENNTTVIEKLPDTIMLHIRAATKV